MMFQLNKPDPDENPAGTTYDFNEGNPNWVSSIELAQDLAPILGIPLPDRSSNLVFVPSARISADIVKTLNGVSIHINNDPSPHAEILYSEFTGITLYQTSKSHDGAAFDLHILVSPRTEEGRPGIDRRRSFSLETIDLMGRISESAETRTAGPTTGSELVFLNLDLGTVMELRCATR